MNPLNWPALDITRPDQARVFLQSLSQVIQGLSTGAGLAQSLNGAGLLSPASLQNPVATLTGSATSVPTSTITALNVNYSTNVSAAFSTVSSTVIQTNAPSIGIAGCTSTGISSGIFLGFTVSGTTYWQGSPSAHVQAGVYLPAGTQFSISFEQMSGSTQSVTLSYGWIFQI